MNTARMMNIKLEEIYSHPDNPRKDIGDVSELAESIKKNGIMQNLTVLSGHALTDEEYKILCEQYREKRTEELRYQVNQHWSDEGYTLLIGHRRCAAARLAGLTEVPCKIVEGMSKKEQVATMLEENMQRNDLTIYEQAQGFQMMLDLGETEEGIAQKTGFSKSTIRHRLNLAKLDQTELKKKNDDESFQLSLRDLYELEKIPDVEMRNKILKKSTNSNNLMQEIEYQLGELKRNKNEKKFRELFEKMGMKEVPKSYEKEQYSSKWETVKYFNLDYEVPKTLQISEPEKCFFTKQYRNMKVVKQCVKENKELTPAEIQAKEREKNEKKLVDMQKEMAAERKDFIRVIIDKKLKPSSLTPEDIQKELFDLMMTCGCWMDHDPMYDFLFQKGKRELTADEKEKSQKYLDKLPLHYQFLIYANKAVSDKDTTEWRGGYRKENGSILMEFEAILMDFGFSYSKPEYTFVSSGVHELYTKI